jgi:hypothetical protein
MIFSLHKSKSRSEPDFIMPGKTAFNKMAERQLEPVRGVFISKLVDWVSAENKPD